MNERQMPPSPRAGTTIHDRLKELEGENELLLLQLHQVQEELEHYFLKYRELESCSGNTRTDKTATFTRVDDELPEAVAEVDRLTVLVETQTRLRRTEAANSLKARLGDILIQSVSPAGSLALLPGKLLKIWRTSTVRHPPARLGGVSFDKVIAAFTEGGFETTDQLLRGCLAPEMKAKAYTALARYLMKEGGFVEAAQCARCAYEEDPQPYRLKWLAFRLHETGEVQEADACLSLLPQETPFSESESRQRDQVRYEARFARLQEAKRKTGFAARQKSFEKQIETLRQDRDRQAERAAERQAEVEGLRQTRSRLEQERLQLGGQLDEAARLVTENMQRIEQLCQATSHLKQENSKLSQQHDQAAKLAAERLKQINELQLQIQNCQAGEADLAARQRLMQEEMVRAEAQLGLIKDWLLRGPGL